MDNVHVKGFFLVGISVRTINAAGQSAKDIAALWKRFMDGDILVQIEDRFTDEIYCVYTDYETDHTGFYTAVLGCRVSSPDNIPEGLISLIVPAANYVKHVAKGPLPDCVVNTWQQIWNGTLNRTYIADFDVWGPKAQNPDNAEVEIYVGVR